MLNGLSFAYGKLGDPPKKRDVLQRSLPIMEREHGKESTNVAVVLTNLGNAYGQLGDQLPWSCS